MLGGVIDLPSIGLHIREHLPKMIMILLAAVAARVFILYLQMPVQDLAWAAVFALVSLAVRMLWHYQNIERRDFVLLGIISMLFSLSVVVGYHIVVSDPYSGLMEDNYLKPFSLIDVIAFLAGDYVSLLVSLGLLSLVRARQAFSSSNVCRTSRANILPLSKKRIAIITCAIFALWAPYLIAYWPGFIFSDTLASLDQVFGYTSWSNHHPVAFTVSLNLCIKLANCFGFSNTTGCALYSIFQMLYLSWGFAYMACWITSRMCFHKWCSYLIALFVGISSIYATYSIALWKDPIFSIALVVLVLQLFDLVRSGGLVCLANKCWSLIFEVNLLLMVLFRNNGIYILALMIVFFVGYALIGVNATKGRRGYGVAIAWMIATCIIYCVINGPVFSILSIQRSESSESLGIPINQMARVAALDGEMSEDDKSYLNDILPLELFPTTYRPCCTDMFKWDAQYVEPELNGEFLQRWLTMFVHNPRVYLDSWILQTFGFWTVNQKETWSFDNIGGGVPRNLEGEKVDLDQYSIVMRNQWGNSAARELFPHDESSLPLGVLLWFTIYMSTLIILLKEGHIVLAFVPLFALIATLLIATPIWYWPRYGAALQFVIPLFLALFARLVGGHRFVG